MDTEGPIVNKKKPEIISKWSDTKKLILKITNKKFRSKFLDSKKGNLIFSWFIINIKILHEIYGLLIIYQTQNSIYHKEKMYQND